MLCWCVPYQPCKQVVIVHGFVCGRVLCVCGRVLCVGVLAVTVETHSSFIVDCRPEHIICVLNMPQADNEYPFSSFSLAHSQSDCLVICWLRRFANSPITCWEGVALFYHMLGGCVFSHMLGVCVSSHILKDLFVLLFKILG